MITTKAYLPTPLEGVLVELQPLFGTLDGAVAHMLPGGISNPEGFGSQLLDIYAFTAQGKNQPRGGHYHLELQELFFVLSGTALWILSDFRQTSPTHGQTHGLILGVNPPPETQNLSCHLLTDGTLPRLRVPAGVYHAIFPLTDERLICVGLGSTTYDKEDYRHPSLSDIPNAPELLRLFNLADIISLKPKLPTDRPINPLP